MYCTGGHYCSNGPVGKSGLDSAILAKNLLSPILLGLLALSLTGMPIHHIPLYLYCQWTGPLDFSSEWTEMQENLPTMYAPDVSCRVDTHGH